MKEPPIEVLRIEVQTIEVLTIYAQNYRFSVDIGGAGGLKNAFLWVYIAKVISKPYFFYIFPWNNFAVNENCPNFALAKRKQRSNAPITSLLAG